MTIARNMTRPNMIPADWEWHLTHDGHKSPGEIVETLCGRILRVVPDMLGMTFGTCRACQRARIQHDKDI